MKSGRMRETLFALVLFYIQCVSGIDGVAKALNKTSIEPTKKSQVNSSSLDKSNKIDEKEIFENGDDKPNNLSERSFIWLNTRFKNPLRTKIYNSKIDEYKINSLYPFKKPQNNVMSLPQRQYPPPPSISLTARHPPSPLSKPGPTSPKIPPSLPNLTANLFIPHHDIKIPCTMPDKYSKTSIKCNEGYSKPYVYNKFREELPKMVPHLKNIVTEVKSELITKPYGFKDVPKNSHSLNSIMRSKAKETYGFPGLFQVHRSAFSTNELLNELSSPDEMNLEGNFVADGNFILSPVDGSDEDKLLERYIKHTLADNGVRLLDDQLHKKCKECNSERSNPNCKCETDAPEVKSKLYQILEKKKEQLDLETTIDNNNKMNDYDDSSNDDTFSNKTMVDVLFTPNKINDLIH